MKFLYLATIWLTLSSWLVGGSLCFASGSGGTYSGPMTFGPAIPISAGKPLNSIEPILLQVYQCTMSAKSTEASYGVFYGRHLDTESGFMGPILAQVLPYNGLSVPGWSYYSISTRATFSSEKYKNAYARSKNVYEGTPGQPATSGSVSLQNVFAIDLPTGTAKMAMRGLPDEVPFLKYKFVYHVGHDINGTAESSSTVEDVQLSTLVQTVYALDNVNDPAAPRQTPYTVDLANFYSCLLNGLPH